MLPRADSIRRMFDAISPRYDLLNHLLSGGVDRRWRAATASRLAEAVAGRADAASRPVRVLDVCTGTGDLAFAILDAFPDAPPPRIVGVDFSRPMLARALRKARRRDRDRVLRWSAADAIRLPFRDEAFDAVTAAFGLRNLVDPDGGLREMIRVLRPGGRLLLLEFGNPRIPGIRHAYQFYFRRVLPAIGGAISKDGDAYHYLPRTVAAFPDRERLAARMEAAGLDRVAFKPLTFGIAVRYEGRKKGVPA